LSDTGWLNVDNDLFKL